MTLYLMALGHDVAQIDLDPIVPQPRSAEGVHNAQRDIAADGSVFEQGLFIPLLWSSLANATAYQTLLTQLGLAAALRSAITLYAPDFQREWHRYNGYALRPQILTYATFPRSVSIVVNRMVRLA